MDLVTGEKIRDFVIFKTDFGYVDTHYLKCENIDKNVYISHNSDGCIQSGKARDCDFDFVEESLPSTFKTLFAQNMDVLSSRVRPLPIGLENSEWHKGKKFLEIEAVMKQNIPKTKWLYVNHEITTNPKEREDPYRIFKNLGFATVVSKKRSYLDYIKDMKSHKFVLCPEGNGLDTHRTWEALYMGAIPIVKKRVFVQMFSRIMPMLIVENWQDITLDYLKREYHRQNRVSKPYGNQYLEMPFWEKVIKGEIKIA